jgi:hypothetical protein
MLRRKSSWVKAFEATRLSSFASHLAPLMVAGWARKLIRPTTPPVRARSAAVCRSAGTPEHSRTTSAPRPRVCSWTPSTASSGVSATEAPSSSARSRRASVGSTTSSCPAPAARANCMASSPMGPAPWTRTVSPGAIRERRTPWKATVAGSTCAASSSVRSGWAGSTRPASTVMLRAKAPCGGANAFRPRATDDVVRQYSARPPRHSGQRPQAGGTATTTRSPSRRSLTSAPTALRTPTHSWPQTAGLCRCPVR